MIVDSIEGDVQKEEGIYADRRLLVVLHGSANQTDEDFVGEINPESDELYFGGRARMVLVATAHACQSGLECILTRVLGHCKDYVYIRRGSPLQL